MALDGLGLLLFFVPGVVAFAVDFATGAVYLPPDQYIQAQTNKIEAQRDLLTVEVPRDQLTRQRIERVVSDHVGRPVYLADGHYRAERIGSIADFWEAVARLTSASV